MRKAYGTIRLAGACLALAGLVLAAETTPPAKAPAPAPSASEVVPGTPAAPEGPAAPTPAAPKAPTPAAPAGEPPTAPAAGLAEAKPAAPGIKPEPGEELFVEPAAGKATARVHVRVGPAVDKALLGTLNRDEAVVALGKLGNWLRIQVPERIPLWIGAQYVDMPAGGAFPATATLKSDKVRVRAAGDLKAPILKELPRGAQVEVMGRVETWLKVKAPPDVTVWVSAGYIELAAAVAKLPPAPRPPEPAGKPPEPGKPAGPVQLKGPGVELFAEAEDSYRQAQAKEPPDYSRAYELYRRALAVKGLPEEARNGCNARLAELDAKVPAEQRQQIDDRLVAERAEKLRLIREELDRAQAAGAPVYVAEGYLTRSPDMAGIPAPYRLTVSGVLMYYLAPAGSAARLDSLVGKQVGVTGRKRFVPGWGTEVIDVLQVQSLGAAPADK